MVEPEGTTLLGAERDMLLATKLSPPRPRPGWVLRPRLTQRLQTATARELTLVCAPAGFGKSSLLADWVRATGRPVAWLSLDAGDNDPVRFWRHVCAAVDRVRPGAGRRAAALVGGAASTAIRAGVTALVNDLAESAEEVVLVIDDHHLIEAPDVHRSLEFLLEHRPSCLRLVLAGRSDPPLRLARPRARGELAELRAADLRFTVGESAELLRTVVGRALADADVAALSDRTEGWVAGLQLAALSLQGRPDVADFVAEFSGSHRYVLDYLSEEVLDGQPEVIRTFLLETSVLERLSGSLCDAVLGRTGSQETLERVEQANLFLLPLDEKRCWWRYHHLFADLLRTRLMQQRPERVPQLHRAAATWHERHGLADEAVRHAVAAADLDRAARIVEEHLEDQVLRLGEDATLIRWLSALPPDAVHRRPRLTLGQAVVALLRGRLDEVEPLLERAERMSAGVEEPRYTASLPRRDSIVANVRAAIAVGRADLAALRGDPERARRYGQQALKSLTAEDVLLAAITRYHLAVADWLDGRLPEAESALADIVLDRPSAAEQHVVLRAGYDLGGVRLSQGRLDAAARTYRRELAADGTGTASAGMAHVGLAEVAYERDELVAAGEHATAGVELCRRLSYIPPLVAGLLALGRVRLAAGDRRAATTALDEAEEVAAGAAHLRSPLPAFRARLMVADGNVDEAARWIRTRGLRVDDEPEYPREHEYLVLARVLLAEEEPRRALGLVQRWSALAAAQGRSGGVIAWQLLAVRAHDAIGDDPAARDVLAAALGLAAPEGFVRVVVDEGAALARPLAELLVGRRLEQLAPATAIPRPFLIRVADAFARSGIPVLPAARRGGAAVPGLIEPLSAREQEVLALLAAGHRNRDIAAELVITLDTVKRHVTHVFDKLGVTSRTQAAARARQLGLLP
jgi:ATP/maltotriose-dependent transcriptional regulator MalT